MTEVLAAVRAAPVAEVSWIAAGSPQVRGVLPLVDQRGPVLAFPYAEAAVARSIAASDEVVLTLTDPHATSSAYRPLLLRGVPRLEEDREGDRFCGGLLQQELRRWPPSRVLADSLLLRRENWWWLPRLLVDLHVEETRPFAFREHADDHLLAVATETRLEVAVARVDVSTAVGPGGTGDPARVDVTVGTPGPGEAVLFGQEVSYPDAERWGQWAWEGSWDGAELQVRTAPAATGLPATPGVVARWRRQRALERACRRGLAT